MIPSFLPSLMLKPEFGSIAAQLSSWDSREEPRPAGLRCPSPALKGGFSSATPSPSLSPALICPEHLLLPSCFSRVSGPG